MASQREQERASEIVGESVAMRAICDRILQMATHECPILLRGEPGTGKMLVARTIHANSGRANRAFVRMHCAAMPDMVLDASVFEGTTGPITSSPLDASIIRADGGTLFLDEVTDLGQQAQDRLLTVAREGVLHWHGRTTRVNARLIAWSSRDLEDGVSCGRFRRDFYEHLSAVTLAVPPLRERKADLPALLQLLVERFAREHARRVDRLSRRASEMVMNYDWPGNVRELSDVVERAVVVASGPVIHHHHLPPAVQAAAPTGSEAPIGLIEAIDAYEKELLQDALRQARGVRSKAARLLRTTDRIFNYKLRKHGIDSTQFKASG
ncbi:MAG TPA: sigma 54-interacting transcriptional regulator [Vicinamibacterales bacterium]|nr:sigma 54-interacting transcriptional regulator [Vicinamibacterales bacterium]